MFVKVARITGPNDALDVEKSCAITSLTMRIVQDLYKAARPADLKGATSCYEKFDLEMSLKYMKSPYLEQRLVGVATIKVRVAACMCCHYYVSGQRRKLSERPSNGDGATSNLGALLCGHSLLIRQCGTAVATLK
jgi:hypothetical protein